MHVRRVAIAAAMLTAAVSSAQAAPLLDQQLIVPTIVWGGGVGCVCPPPGDGLVAQTFTVGIQGQLVRVDLLVNSTVAPDTATLTIEIRRTVSGLPDIGPAGLLASTSAGRATLPHPDTGWASFSFTQQPLVSAGDVLGIVLAANGGNFGFGGLPANPYTGGDFFSRGPRSWDPWVVDGWQGDLGFRTYVERVPEPALPGLLLVAVAIARIRRPEAR